MRHALAASAATTFTGLPALAPARAATREELREAVAMSAISRHWSIALNGMAVDLATFWKEADEAPAIAKHRPAAKSIGMGLQILRRTP